MLTDQRVIDIKSGATPLQSEEDQLGESRLQLYPRFHALSQDERYALSTVVGGHLKLWNITRRTSWRPALPAHGGVHYAIFLPPGKAALDTAEGGLIVVDCTPAVAPGDIEPA